MASLALGLGGAGVGAQAGFAAGLALAPFTGGASFFLGSSIGAAVGGSLGGIAGSVIDKTLLFPALVGRQTSFRGQQLTDIPITSASVGSPINVCMGRQVRVPGTILWISSLKTVPNTEHIGGKGGTSVVTNDYYLSIAIGVCQGPIRGIRKVWADGILLYDEGSNILGGSDNRYDSITLYDGTQAETPASVIQTGSVTSATTNTVTLADFEGASSVDNFYQNAVITFTSGTGSGVAQFRTILGYTGSTRVAKITGEWVVEPDNTSAYSISSTAADPIIAAFEGAENTPAFVNLAYVVIENLNTSPWGQRIPNFHFLVEAQEQTLLADAVREIWLSTGRSVDELDVSYLAAEEVVGYTLVGPQQPNQALEPLMTAFDLVLQEQSGITSFLKRADSTQITLDPSKFAAYEENGGDPIRAIRIEDIADYSLPKEVLVQYLDPAMFWQVSAQRQTKQSAIVQRQTTVNLPLVMTGSTARSIAKRILWSNWAERWNMSFSLMPSQIHLQESDLFLAEVDNFGYNGRVMSITRGQNWVLEVKGSAEQQSILTQQAVADIPGISAEPEPAGTTEYALVLLEIGTLPNDTYFQGVHFAVSRSIVGNTWYGGSVYTSGNELINYAQWYSFLIESVIGTVQSGVLPNNPSLTYWDNKTVIQVQMNTPVGPVSVTDDDVLSSWLNHAYIGLSDGTGEVIAFVNVEQVDDITYNLSRILRGRLGTDSRTNGHATLEYFVILGDSSYAGTHWVSTGQVGQTVYHKPDPPNIPLRNIAPVPSTRLNFAQTPWSVCHVTGKRDVSNNLTIKWSRRCNTPCVLFPHAVFAEVPLNFATNEYDVVIYSDNTFTTIKSTHRVAGNETIGTQNSWAYSAIMQTADGLTLGASVAFIIFQININLGAFGNRGVGSNNYL